MEKFISIPPSSLVYCHHLVTLALSADRMRARGSLFVASAARSGTSLRVQLAGVVENSGDSGVTIASLHLIRTASSRRMKPGGLPCLERTSRQSFVYPETIHVVPVAMLPTFREEGDGSSKTDVLRTV